MARPLWKGSINFGLISIPVKMYKAASPKDLHFRELHDTDGVPLKQKRVCPADGKEVDYEHVVKGYELSRDRFIVLKPEEIEALEQHMPHSIDIESFVELSKIDPVFYKQSYYLVPDRGSTKAYALLLAAMKETNRAAVARFVLRMKEHIAAFRPAGKALALSTLYYIDEVTSQEELEDLPKDVSADQRELKVAVQIIDSLTEEFNPGKYRNLYRDRLLELIEAKAQGQTLKAPKPSKKPAEVVDLMAALQASLKAAGKKPQEKEKPAARKASRRRAA